MKGILGQVPGPSFIEGAMLALLPLQDSHSLPVCTDLQGSC